MTWEKTRALELLAKHLGMLREQIDHRHVGPVRVMTPEQLREPRQTKAARRDAASSSKTRSAASVSTLPRFHP